MSDAEEATGAAVVHLRRNGSAWAITMPIWTDAQRAWITGRGTGSRRLTSADVGAFLHEFVGEYDTGPVAIRPFDIPDSPVVALPYLVAAEWFLGLADE